MRVPEMQYPIPGRVMGGVQGIRSVHQGHVISSPAMLKTFIHPARGLERLPRHDLDQGSIPVPVAGSTELLIIRERRGIGKPVRVARAANQNHLSSGLSQTIEIPVRNKPQLLVLLPRHTDTISTILDHTTRQVAISIENDENISFRVPPRAIDRNCLVEWNAAIAAYDELGSRHLIFPVGMQPVPHPFPSAAVRPERNKQADALTPLASGKLSSQVPELRGPLPASDNDNSSCGPAGEKTTDNQPPIPAHVAFLTRDLRSEYASSSSYFRSFTCSSLTFMTAPGTSGALMLAE